MGPIRIFEIHPRPCGHVHRHLRDIWECLEANGVPGLDFVEVRVPRQ